MATRYGYGPGIELPKEREPESWGDYALRNVLKTPTVAAEGLLGAPGAIERTLYNFIAGSPEAYEKNEEVSGKPATDLFKKLGTPNAIAEFGGAPPTPQSINKRLQEAGLPEYLTEHRPEDFLPMLLQGSLVPGALAGAFRTAGQFGKFAGLTGLSSAGAIGAQKGAEYLGAPEEVQEAAALGGGLFAPLAAKAITSPISSRYKKLEFAKKKNQWESQKIDRLAALEEEHQSTLNDIKERETRNLQEVKDTIAARKAEDVALAAEQETQYGKAKKHEGGKIGAEPILREISEIRERLAHGVPAEDVAVIEKLLNDIENKITLNRKTGEYVIPLKSAKLFKENMNQMVYKKGAPTFVETAYEAGLEPFREQIATAKSKHEIPYRKGETATAKRGELRAGEKDFVKEQRDNRRLIKQEARKERTAAENEYKNKKNAEKKLTYEEHLEKQASMQKVEDKIINTVAPYAKRGLAHTTLGAIGYGLYGAKGQAMGHALAEIGIFTRNEITELSRLFRENPEFYKDAKQIAQMATKKHGPAFAQRVLLFDDKIRKAIDKQESEPEGTRYGYGPQTTNQVPEPTPNI
jgi:hypothetical protein